MRLLTVTHFFEGHGGGIERVAGHLCRAFAAEGLEVAWAAAGEPCTPDTAKPLPLTAWNGIERVTGLPMPLPSGRSFATLWRAVADSDAVLIHDTLYIPTIAALLFARMKRKPVLLVQHVGALPFRSRILRGVIALANRLVTRPMLAAADRVIFISATTRAHFHNARFARPSELLFNGVDASIFHAEGKAAALDRPLRPRIMFAGRFVEKKGLATIRALAQMRPDLDFVLAGRGPINPDEWQLSNVEVRRDVSGQALANLYRSSDIFLLPSIGEGYPLVIQEAMACGLPIICGAESAQADPGASSFLTPLAIDLHHPEANAAAASRAIDSMAMDPARRAAMAAYAQRHYRWDATAARIAALATALVAERTRPLKRAQVLGA